MTVMPDPAHDNLYCAVHKKFHNRVTSYPMFFSSERKAEFNNVQEAEKWTERFAQMCSIHFVTCDQDITTYIDHTQNRSMDPQMRECPFAAVRITPDGKYTFWGADTRRAAEKLALEKAAIIDQLRSRCAVFVPPQTPACCCAIS